VERVVKPTKIATYWISILESEEADTTYNIACRAEQTATRVILTATARLLVGSCLPLAKALE
jgi:hypothetical protein